MTCAKRHVIAYIMDGDRIVAAGSNRCHSPQTTCPRAPDEGYEKCRSICHQTGHAETMAIWNAAERGVDLNADDHGLRLVVVGHHRACDMCASAAASVNMPVTFA
jgi:deoxycytidylate deaminase